MRKSKIRLLNQHLKPLCEDCLDLPSERLPEPTWIEVSIEEYKRMFEPMNMDKDVLLQINKLEEKLKDQSDLLQMLEKQDEHLVRVLHWIDHIELMISEVQEADNDKELEDSLREIVSRLTQEAGVRLSMLMS